MKDTSSRRALRLCPQAHTHTQLKNRRRRQSTLTGIIHKILLSPLLLHNNNKCKFTNYTKATTKSKTSACSTNQRMHSSVT